MDLHVFWGSNVLEQVRSGKKTFRRAHVLQFSESLLFSLYTAVVCNHFQSAVFFWTDIFSGEHILAIICASAHCPGNNNADRYKSSCACTNPWFDITVLILLLVKGKFLNSDLEREESHVRKIQLFAGNSYLLPILNKYVFLQYPTLFFPIRIKETLM